MPKWLTVFMGAKTRMNASAIGRISTPRPIRRPFGKGCIDSIILGEPSDLRFVGEQKGADWTLKREGTDEPIEVTKKGDQIELVRSENRETLSERPGTISCCSGRRPDRHPPE